MNLLLKILNRTQFYFEEQHNTFSLKNMFWHPESVVLFFKILTCFLLLGFDPVLGCKLKYWVQKLFLFTSPRSVYGLIHLYACQRREIV